MRQIGVRDKAKLIGGLGICGKELCCRLFLTSFEPISIKMAKQQDLSLITGSSLAPAAGLCAVWAMNIMKTTQLQDTKSHGKGN